MRIGIDCRYLREPPRGVGHYLINILARFDSDNGDFFYLYSPGPIRNNPQGENFVIRKGRFPLPGTFWLQTEGKHLITSDRLDTFWAPCDILPLGLTNKTRKVLSVHDLNHLYFPQTMANYNLLVHKLFFSQSLKIADHIITMTNFIKQDIISRFEVPTKKITAIYEGVNEKFRPYPKNEVQEVLNRFGLEKPYILSVGTLEPRKNYPTLLQAFKNLKNDYNLVIVGKKGWKANKIFATIRRLRLENEVIILGYVKDEDLPYLYNGAELFVFPSLYEGFGLPVLEAMACGVPVICSNSSSLPEVGEDAVLYFESNSTDDLIAKMQILLTNEQLRNTLREKGIEQAKKFDWKKTARQTLSILKGV